MPQKITTGFRALVDAAEREIETLSVEEALALHGRDDVTFIERLGARDEEAVELGQVKPCQMIAAMRARPVERSRYYRHWSPEFCLRVPD